MSESGFCDVDGGQLYYEVEGSGPPVTLIHAGIANLRQWDPQVPAFARTHRVIRYDTRNFGRTTSDNVTFSNRADLATLLDHLGVASTAIVGNSRGGTIAVDFALENPERVTALVPVGAGISGLQSTPSPAEQEMWEEYDRRYEARDWSWIVETETSFWVDGPGQGPDRVAPEVRRQVHDWIAQGYLDHEGEELVSEPLKPPAFGRLGEIRVPTLVIMGDLDERATLDACRRLATDIPDARLEVFESVAHLVNLEQPDRFTRLVTDFLAEVEGSPATALTGEAVR